MIKVDKNTVGVDGSGIEVMAEYSLLTFHLMKIFHEQGEEDGVNLIKRAYKIGKNTFKEYLRMEKGDVKE